MFNTAIIQGVANYLRHASIVCSVLIALAAPSHAGIAELLLKKGVITHEEYQKLKEETAREASTKILREELPTPAPATTAIGFSKGFNATAIDGSYNMQIGTLMQLDIAGYRDDSGIDNNSGTEMRRGRLYMQGKILTDWQYKFEMEVFGTTGTEVTDAFVRYNGFLPVADGRPLGITLGNFKIPFSFEQMMADKDLSLMERSLPNALLKSRAPGAMLSWGGDHWSAAAMLFGEQLTSNTSNPQDEGGGASLRATWAPWVEDGATLHVGAAAQYGEPTQKPGGATLRYDSRPESRMTALQLVDTGAMTGVEDARLYGLEAAATLGSLSFNTEYIRADVARATGDATFAGWYAQAAWMLSGEVRSYNVDNGVFKAIQPLHPVGIGGNGAWELTARYSRLDLNDGAISGGEEENATLGLGWYANPYVRISGNWVHVLDLNGGLYDGKEVDALQMRFQFAY